MPSAGTKPTQLLSPRVSFAGHKETETKQGNKFTFDDFMIVSEARKGTDKQTERDWGR